MFSPRRSIPIQRQDEPMVGCGELLAGHDEFPAGLDIPIQDHDKPATGPDIFASGLNEPLSGADVATQGQDVSVMGPDIPGVGTEVPSTTPSACAGRNPNAKKFFGCCSSNLAQ